MRSKSDLYFVILWVVASIAVTQASSFLLHVGASAPPSVPAAVAPLCLLALVAMFGFPDYVSVAQASSWGMVIGFIFSLCLLLTDPSRFAMELREELFAHFDGWRWAEAPLWSFGFTVFFITGGTVMCGYLLGFAFAIPSLLRKRNSPRKRR